MILRNWTPLHVDALTPEIGLVPEAQTPLPVPYIVPEHEEWLIQRVRIRVVGKPNDELVTRARLVLQVGHHVVLNMPVAFAVEDDRDRKLAIIEARIAELERFALDLQNTSRLPADMPNPLSRVSPTTVSCMGASMFRAHVQVPKMPMPMGTRLHVLFEGLRGGPLSGS